MKHCTSLCSKKISGKNLSKKQDLSTKHFGFNGKSLFRQNSLLSKNLSRGSKADVFFITWHVPSSGKHIYWDKGIILMCRYFTTKTCVKIFHQNCWGKPAFWLNRKKKSAHFSTEKTPMPQLENLSRILLLQCFKRKLSFFFSEIPLLWPLGQASRLISPSHTMGRDSSAISLQGIKSLKMYFTFPAQKKEECTTLGRQNLGVHKLMYTSVTLDVQKSFLSYPFF